MSGIAGVFHLDGCPADLTALHRMGEALAWRGPDGIGYWHSGPVGFAHAQFCTTPESLQEKQPLCSPGAGLCLTFDGRIDNRDEILQALRSDGTFLPDNTDPALLLAAYRLWGTDCLQRIVGDFAFALWDQARRILWCARDHIGIRPFYYVHSPKLFLFSSDIQSLLTNPSVSQAVNEGMAAEYLARTITSRAETLYRDIQRLPSSSTLTLTCDGKFRLASWWRPDFNLIRYRSDEEYGEHFTQLLNQSVAARMRSHGGWACQLSGGLDSSTVAVTAQALLDLSGSAQRVQTFSTASPGKPWDESEYIAETVRFANLKSQCLPPGAPELNQFRETARWSRDFPDYPNGSPMLGGIYQTAATMGIRVILTGQGGNDLLEGRLPHLLDYAVQGRWQHLAKIGKADWEIHQNHGSWQVFILRKLISESAPSAVQMWRTRRRLVGKSFLSAQLLRRTQLSERLHVNPRPDVPGIPSYVQRDIFHILQSGIEAHSQEQIDLHSTRSGIEERHPFFDRRMVEFCLRLPEEQRQRGIAWKWVLRTAMRARLPAMVLTRTAQPDFFDFFYRSVTSPSALQGLRQLHLRSSTDWLDSSRVASLIETLEGRHQCPPGHVIAAWMILGTDLWFGTLAKSAFHIEI